MSLESHRAVEAAVGLVLVLVPFALRFGLDDGADFSGAAIVVCAVIGLTAATLGFTGTRLGSDPSGRSHAELRPRDHRRARDRRDRLRRAR